MNNQACATACHMLSKTFWWRVAAVSDYIIEQMPIRYEKTKTLMCDVLSENGELQ